MMALIDRTGGYRSWPSVTQFYEERGGRFSGQYHLGDGNWSDSGQDRFTPLDQWMVSLVADTADLYAVDLHGGEALLLGTLTPTEDDREEAARTGMSLWGAPTYPAVYAAADRVFDDYGSDGLGKPLSWFAERLAGQQEAG